MLPISKAPKAVGSTYELDSVLVSKPLGATSKFEDDVFQLCLKKSTIASPSLTLNS